MCEDKNIFDEDGKAFFDLNDGYLEEKDIITIELASKTLNIDFNKLCKHSKLIRDDYKKSDIKDRLIKDLKRLENDYNITEDSFITFFQILNEEKIRKDFNYNDICELSGIYKVKSLNIKLSIFFQKYINDVDYIIKQINDNSVNKRTEYIMKMEECLQKNINKCLENQQFGHFPIQRLYTIISNSDQKMISCDELYDFISQSINDRHVLFPFIHLNKLSDSKFDELYQTYENTDKSLKNIYFNFSSDNLSYIKTLKEEIKKLIIEKDDNRKLRISNEQLQKEIDKLSNDKNQLQILLNQTIEKKKEIEDQFKLLENEKNQQQHQINEINKIKEELQKVNIELTNDTNQFIHQIDELKKENNQMQIDIENMKNEKIKQQDDTRKIKEEFQREIDHLKEYNIQLQNQINQLNNDKNQFQNQNEKLKNEKIKLNDQINELMNDKNLKENQINNLINEKTKLQTQNNAINNTISELQTEINNLNKGKNELQKMLKETNEKIDEFQNQINSLNNEKTQLQNQINSLNSEKTEFHNQINNLNNEKIQFQSQINNLNNEKTQFQSQINNLNNEKTQLQNQINSLNNEKTQLQNQINSLNNEKTQFQNQINNLENDKTQLQNSNYQLEKKINELILNNHNNNNENNNNMNQHRNLNFDGKFNLQMIKDYISGFSDNLNENQSGINFNIHKTILHRLCELEKNDFVNYVISLNTIDINAKMIIT